MWKSTGDVDFERLAPSLCQDAVDGLLGARESRSPSWREATCQVGLSEVGRRPEAEVWRTRRTSCFSGTSFGPGFFSFVDSFEQSRKVILGIDLLDFPALTVHVALHLFHQCLIAGIVCQRLPTRVVVIDVILAPARRDGDGVPWRS